MMKKVNILRYKILFVALSAILVGQATAQKSDTREKHLVEVKSKVLDESGNPVNYAMVSGEEGKFVRFTNEAGEFVMNVTPDAVLLIEASGFTPASVDLKSQALPEIVTLKKSKLEGSEYNFFNRLDGGKTSQLEFVGSMNSISSDDLTSYPDLTLSNTLQGKAAGLIVRPNNSGLGNNNSSIYIRGLHTNGSNEAIVLVDGFERPIDDILPQEIESIEVLKDAVAKVAYGPTAANGVILITTKRGKAYKREIKTTVEGGIMQSMRVPKFLNSYDYATLYNEALTNDGLPELYQPYQLDGYKNSTGVNDLLYPNVDYYDYFLNSQSTYRKGTVEFNGGNDKAKYALVTGYTGGSGLEKVGKRSDLNRLSVRGNLDLKLNDFLSVVADVAGRMEMREWGIRDNATVMSALSSTHPNEYPFTIAPESIGLTPTEDGVPFFGGSTRKVDNLYADLLYGGSTSERYITSQTNLGLDFNLGQYVKGLTASGFITFDNYSYLRQQMSDVYPTYGINTYSNAAGVIDTTFTQLKKISLTKDWAINDDQTRRTLGWRANFGYKNSFDKHDISAMIAFRYYKNENDGTTQDQVYSNNSIRLNYTFDKRYMLEATVAYMGSNKFDKDNRHFLSPVVGLAWIASNEGFLKNSSTVNFLKFKGSYGVLGFVSNTGYNLYATAWQDGGTTPFGEQNNNSSHYTTLVRIGNPELKWETSTELSVGAEAAFFRNRLSGEVNYFNELHENIIGLTALYPSSIGSFYSNSNIGSVKNQGVDLTINWSDKLGKDFSYDLGVNFTYSVNKYTEWNDIPGTEAYRQNTGHSVGAIYGLQSRGLFGKDVQLAGSPLHTFGAYQNGDIAYADLNGDQMIDNRDQTVIGNNFPSTSWGININFKYKGWGCYILGTAETGTDKLLTNSYYWNNGDGKYSVLAMDSYNEVRNPDGIFPRLTTANGGNSFQNSSFWLADGSFFRLKNVELSYTFINKTGKVFGRDFKLFARGTNLLVLSAIKDSDPECVNAGVGNYPVYSAITGGISVNF